MPYGYPYYPSFGYYCPRCGLYHPYYSAYGYCPHCGYGGAFLGGLLLGGLLF
jgi:hypothetical protein